jgi:type II secretory pathway component GspD/PulD (secretin)
MFVTLTHSHSKLVTMPVITTTNNTPATINLNTQIPYTTQTVVTGGANNNNIVTTQQNFIQVPTNLTVTPRINANDTITMLVNPSLSETGPVPTTGPPAVTTQTVNALRTIRNGETMIVAGFTTKSETKATTRFPILSDIPIIRNLFRSKNTQTSDRELLIFVTATLIESVGEDTGSGNITP